MPIFNQADYLPSLRYDDRTSQSWAVTGNTNVVTNAHCRSNSIILVVATAAKNGHWYITPANGSFTITSSDVEAAGTTFNYLIL